jgi:HD-GYP domain-containing protein (c-di-GMP phosphodiesterase class II)
VPQTAAEPHSEILSTLERHYGVAFDVWALEGTSVASVDQDSSAPYPDSDELSSLIRDLVQTACSERRPLLRATEGGEQLLAVPLPTEDGAPLAAVASCPHPSDALLEQHAGLILNADNLRREVDRLSDESSALVTQVVQSFEELTFIRDLAQRMALPECTGSATEIGQEILPDLQVAAEAEGVMLLLDGETEGEEPAAPPAHGHLCQSGVCPIDEPQYRRLIARYGELAASRPLVRNAVPDTSCGSDFPGLREFVLVEIRNEGRVYGWLVACNRVDGQSSPSTVYAQEGFTSVEATLLASAASMLAASLHNLDLLRQKDALFTDMVRALVSTLDARDPYTRGHSERVARYSQRLGLEIGLDSAACERLYLAGLLHDIGKIAVPDAQLRKAGPLTDDEHAVFSRHPEAGWHMLRDLRALSHVLAGVRHHHEHYDGTGYPHQLAGDEIPVDGRIVAICDSYDAMTSDRPYRRQMPQERAESILREGSGTQWDPTLIQAFLAAMPDILAIRRRYSPPASLDEKL